MPSPSKKPRLHLRNRARDDVLLNRLLSEVRSHEKKVREELRRADETIADMRKELDQERGYTSRVKKEREQARVKLDDALADLDAARHDLAEEQNARVGNETAHRRTISELEAAVADALRKKNRERIVRDAAVKKKVTMDLQREVEKTFKTLLEKCDHIFQASGMQFDVDASSSEDEGLPAAAGRCSPLRARVDEQPAPSAPKKPDIETSQPAPAAETSDTSATASESQ